MSHIFIHIIRRRILRWVRIWSRNFNLTYAFSRKMGLKKIAWAEYKNFALYELFIKFWVEICAYCMFDSCMTHNIEISKNKPMSHNSWLEENFWQNYPSHFRSSKLNLFDQKKLWLLWSLAPVLMQQRFFIKNFKN